MISGSGILRKLIHGIYSSTKLQNIPIITGIALKFTSRLTLKGIIKNIIIELAVILHVMTWKIIKRKRRTGIYRKRTNDANKTRQTKMPTLIRIMIPSESLKKWETTRPNCSCSTASTK